MSIEIPDWVVEAAADAYVRSRGVYEGEIPLDHDDIREALSAALEGLLVPVYQIRTVAHRTWSEFKPTHYEHILANNDDGFYEGRILYTLRKDKTP